jgi:uncharacterized protein (TIGR04141 family)
MRDILSGITGNPADRDLWGPRVDGRDALGVHAPIAFDQLGDLARRIAQAQQRQDYKEGFGWIDNVRFVQDERQRESLVELVLSQLRAQDAPTFELGIPEVIDWAAVASFRFSFDRDVTRSDLLLSSYLGHLEAKGKLAALDLARLRRDRVSALDDAGRELYHWSVWRCLDGQVQLDGSTYVLDGGDFYQIDPDFLRALDSFLDGVPSGRHGLPDAVPGEREDHYLARVSQAGGDFLLLDQRLVSLEARTTPVEICDLLARDGTLLHAKKGRSSSELSHLFSQGLVSAELMVTSPVFREKVREKVAEVAGNLPAASKPWPEPMDPDRFSAASHEVSFVVIRRPLGTGASSLPFFSKVNLRRCLGELSRMGYPVACQLVRERRASSRRKRRDRLSE